jgi:hypothetical protein
VLKSKITLVVVPSECKISLKRRLSDKGVAQKLYFRLTLDAHVSEDDITPKSDNDTKEDDQKIRTDTTEPRPSACDTAPAKCTCSYILLLT